MKEDMTIFILKYLFNHWSDLTNILNLNFDDLTNFICEDWKKQLILLLVGSYSNFKFRINAHIQNRNISETTSWIILKLRFLDIQIYKCLI